MSTYYQSFAGMGQASSAFLAFSNIGASHFGIMPLILNNANRQKAGLDVRGSVQAWDFFFTRATIPVVVGCLVQSASYLAASTYIGASPRRSLFWAASLLGISPLAFTGIFILPSIKALKEFSTRPATQSIGAAEEKRALEKLREWNNMHLIRVGIYCITLVTGALAINADKL